MFKTQLTTTNFSFEAFGKTQEDSWAALVKGLKKHIKQYELDETEFFTNYLGDIFTTEIKIGACYRDNEGLTNA